MGLLSALWRAVTESLQFWLRVWPVPGQSWGWDQKAAPTVVSVSVLMMAADTYHQRLPRWRTGSRRSAVHLWAELLRNAETYEDWKEAALHLDNLLGLDKWRKSAPSRCYDHDLIAARLESVAGAREAADLDELASLLPHSRHVGGITGPDLYEPAFAGTKHLVEEYVAQTAEAVEDLCLATGRPPGDGRYGRLVRIARETHGRTALVMRGGAGAATTMTTTATTMLLYYHLGVARALFLRGLLPRVIVGEGTGAVVAALVAAGREEQMVPALARGGGYGLSVAGGGASMRWDGGGEGGGGDALDKCLRANLGDLTFAEAHQRSGGRVLGIIVSVPPAEEETVFSHVTTPDVLVRTAAMAAAMAVLHRGSPPSNILLCRDGRSGQIAPWTATGAAAGPPVFRLRPSDSSPLGAAQPPSPLNRAAALFGVNHLVVSEPQTPLCRLPLLAARLVLDRTVGLAFRHRLSRRLRPLLPARLLRLGRHPASRDGGHHRRHHHHHHQIVLTPEFSVSDLGHRLGVGPGPEPPAEVALDAWALLRGERAVWPAVAAVRVRCAIENELELACRASATDRGGAVPAGGGRSWRPSRRKWS